MITTAKQLRLLADRTGLDAFAEVLRDAAGMVERLEGQVRELERAAIASAAQMVPPGYVPVPVEPTDDMLRGLRKQRSGGLIGKGDRAAWAAWLAAAPKAAPAQQAGAAYAELPKDAIRSIFLAHGFTIKEGQTDLKQYVYDAANALLRASRGQAPAPAAVAGPSEDEDRLFAAWLTRELCLPTDADLTQYDAAYLPYRAWKARAAIAAPAPAAQGDALPWLQAEDMAALERFAETTDDDEDYDIGKDAVQRLAGFGCLRAHGFGKYSITDFGRYVLNDRSLARELPFRTQPERDAEQRAARAAKEGAQP